MRTSSLPNTPPPVPDVELFNFQTLPETTQELPPNLEIPTHTITGVEKLGRYGNIAVRYTLEMPEEVIDPVPLGFAHGWFGVERGYTDLRHWVAQNGKPAVTVRPARVIKNLGGYHPKHLMHPETLLCQTMYGAMKGIQKSKEAEHMGIDASEGDLFAHSMGGRTAAVVAEKRPDLVRSITFVAAAGLEPHSVPEFLKSRIPDFLTKEIPAAYKDGHFRPYLRLSAAEELADYALRGGFRALREGISVGNCDIREAVHNLGELGVRTAMLEFKKDAMIPAYQSLRYSGPLVDIAALFPYDRVGHLGPQTHVAHVGQAQFEILDALNGTNLAGRTPSQDTAVTRRRRAA